MALGGADAKRPAPVMNVTPLVDVTLVVLIIFMVVTPMMTKTFWLNLPKQDDKQEAPPPNADQPLVLTIDKAGAIRVNTTLLKPEEIPTRLPRMLAAKKQKVLYVDAHDGVPYGKVVETMDLARQGGAKSIAMLTQTVVK
jgi:biopolymer transport protein ExbD